MQIDFWFSVGSTYTYLTVMRLPEVEARSGLTFNWRPFSVRQIMLEMDNVPFAKKPVKAGYMWRDIERRAAMYGLRPRLPAPYPLEEFDLANRIAIVGRQEGWCDRYVREAYRRWFEAGEAAGSEPNRVAALQTAGQDPARVVALAQSDEIGTAYEDATAQARSIGVFGSPTFAVGSELFWGDDRLEDAISWVRHGEVRPVATI